jgi:hypothetical protein
MTRFTCLFEELDDQTREYLRAVRASHARGMPGVIFTRSNPWPAVALGCGPIVALVFVVLGFMSLKDAWATAMLQTAGVLLGGWLILYGVRRLLAKSSSKFAGFFTYFDPYAAYQAHAETVTVTDVTNATSVDAMGGKNSIAGVRFADPSGAQLVMGLTPPQAVFVEDYYAAMDWITKRDEDGKKLSAAVLGGAAKEYALTEQLPRDYAQLNLEVEEIPAAPEKVRTAGPKVFWYLFWPLVGVGAYAFFAAVGSPVRDEAAFASAGNTPQGLRSYLLDDRNTAHRDEALKKLAALYDSPVERVRTNPAAHRDLREATARLVDSLRGPEPPVVTVRVTNAEGNNPKLAEFELRNLHEQIGDGLAQSIGTEYVRFLTFDSAPGENPHLDVVVSVTPAGTSAKVACDVTIRLKPDGEPIAKTTVAPAPPGPGGEFTPDPASRARLTVLTALVGESRGPPPPVIDDDTE